MRIVYLHQYFNTPDMVGGTRSYEMARRMVMAGHQVDMVTSRTDNAFTGNEWVRETISGINVHWLPVQYNNSMSIARRLLAFTEFARKTGAYAAKLEADVVFASSTPLTIALPGVRASRKRKVPLVFEVRDLWPEVPIAMGALRLPGSAFLAKRLEKWAYENSERIVALSPGMREGVINAGIDPAKVSCIPNSADFDLFNCAPSVGEGFRASRPWLGERPLVLYAGTFGRVNGVDYMVKLAEKMLGINSDVRFLAVGAGAEWDSVRNLASASGVLDVNFFMESAVPKKEVAQMFSAATICCSWVIGMEELWKNSANKVFDAMAAAKPVAINHGGWQKQLIEDHGIGVALPTEVSEAAAIKLNEFLLQPALVESAGQAAFKLAEAEFSRDILAKRLIGVLGEAVES
ncbi:glycosyltransferase family 4 protein [Marinobacter sp.]|uniref:glycosyltransferase family 4 protein n=1 Tax=Marinobacter sp. TaxID=50741 RepID=UPI002B27BD11|nr:glycosyltransferase family 4 protein [Marinobacter sp.]